MIKILRLILLFFLGMLICLFFLLLCLFSPKNPKWVSKIAQTLGKLSPILGIKRIIRIPNENRALKKCIFIGNHQSNWDVILGGNVVLPNTITIGKKNLAMIPIFGQLYFLSGNILIDRENKKKARNTILNVVEKIKTKIVSIWIFPEGTRNLGKGLLPFKLGAFHLAIESGVPIVPVCFSEYYSNFDLNRLNNGTMIIEMLPPIDVSNYDSKNVRELMQFCRTKIEQKIQELNKESESFSLKSHKKEN